MFPGPSFSQGCWRGEAGRTPHAWGCRGPLHGPRDAPGRGASWRRAPSRGRPDPTPWGPPGPEPDARFPRGPLRCHPRAPGRGRGRPRGCLGSRTDPATEQRSPASRGLRGTAASNSEGNSSWAAPGSLRRQSRMSPRRLLPNCCRRGGPGGRGELQSPPRAAGLPSSPAAGLEVRTEATFGAGPARRSRPPLPTTQCLPMNVSLYLRYKSA